MKIEFTKIEKLKSHIDDQIIENVLHPGIALLYGQAKNYKSIFATSLSKSISDVLIIEEMEYEKTITFLI